MTGLEIQNSCDMVLESDHKILFNTRTENYGFVLKFIMSQLLVKGKRLQQIK